jgi:hypothetical protein
MTRMEADRQLRIRIGYHVDQGRLVGGNAASNATPTSSAGF